MGVNSSKGFNFRLMASGSAGFTQLDTFADEDILVSNNVTGLFDLGVLPSDFTRQITIPGTKVNNAFFQHVYDIAVENPYLFRTNVKVPAYFDFDGIMISQGYLQLNQVNVYANKYVESYEISIYGGLSSFGRDINRNFLTDLTSSLAQYNHTASYANISASWGGNLFDGDIVYPLVEYGQKIQYTPEEAFFGIDSQSGSLCVQDFKPAIRVVKVWDAIFEQFGYTYSSSFMEQPFLENEYVLCNNNLRYPIFDEYDLETYGLFRIAPLSGSGTDVLLTAGNNRQLEWYNIQENSSNNLSSNLEYTVEFPTQIRGLLNLNFEVSSSSAGNGIPQFFMQIKNTGNTFSSSIALVNYNTYMTDVQIYNSTQTRTEKFTLLTEWNSAVLPVDDYEFYIRYENQGGSNFAVIVNPDSSVTSFLQVTKVNQGGDGLVMNIANNMPFGTSGIKLIDFITSFQKKYNLVIYPNLTQNREFIIETFNNWYNKGEIRDFNKYINLNEKISATPANNLAVNELNFGDTLDGDYLSQQFSKGAGREYGKSYYVDTDNFFSQGKFEVKSGFASTPLAYLANTGTSGSAQGGEFQFRSTATATTVGSFNATAVANIRLGTQYLTQATATVFSQNSSVTTNSPTTGFYTQDLNLGDIISFEAQGGGATNYDYSFEKDLDGVLTVLDSGTSTTTFFYTITSTDIAATVAKFLCVVQDTD
jgi:soluble lytic murein transglycosylase-like protein